MHVSSASSARCRLPGMPHDHHLFFSAGANGWMDSTVAHHRLPPSASDSEDTLLQPGTAVQETKVACCSLVTLVARSIAACPLTHVACCCACHAQKQLRCDRGHLMRTLWLTTLAQHGIPRWQSLWLGPPHAMSSHNTAISHHHHYMRLCGDLYAAAGLMCRSAGGRQQLPSATQHCRPLRSRVSACLTNLSQSWQEQCEQMQSPWPGCRML